jgi:pimeloyl-ACP methyl ester carboxylesterase
MTVAHERRGQGPPLLLVHGLGGVGRYWDPLVDRLTDAFDVIVVDLPGFGGSPALRDLAVALGELLDDLDLDTVHVVGHSLGGGVAFELGAIGRARSITGLAPAGLWADDEQAGRSRVRLQVTHGIAALTRPAIRPVIRLTSRFAPLPHGLTRDGALALYDSYSTSPGFGPVFRGVTGHAFSDGALLTMPVTVVFGLRDTVIVSADRRRDRLPGHVRWIEFDRATHNVPWERQRDVLRLIRETTEAAESSAAR